MGNKEWFWFQSQTWSRDSHGLFDYEFKKWHIDDFKLDEECQIIYRWDDGIRLAQNYTKLKEAKDKAMKQFSEANRQEGVFFTVLGFIINDKNGYKISSINHYSTFFKHKEILKEKFESFKYEQYGNYNNLNSVGIDNYWRDIWKIARDPRTMHNLRFKPKERHSYLGEELQQGDIIKIGRIKFKLKKFCLAINSNPFSVVSNAAKQKDAAKEKENIRHSALVSKSYKKEMFIEKNEEIPPCRFWLSNEMDDNTNPLINPWECKGTMGLLHIECMKHWLDTKKTVKEYNDNTCIIYTWKIVSCELWKQPYPHTIHFKDKSVWILEYDEPVNEPYIIFETFPKEGSK